MGTKPRSPGQIAFSVSMEERLRDEIDARSESLGLNRSQYLAILARRDLATGGGMTIPDHPKLPPVPAHTTDTSFHRKKRKAR